MNTHRSLSRDDARTALLALNPKHTEDRTVLLYSCVHPRFLPDLTAALGQVVQTKRTSSGIAGALDNRGPLSGAKVPQSTFVVVETYSIPGIEAVVPVRIITDYLTDVALLHEANQDVEQKIEYSALQEGYGASITVSDLLHDILEKSDHPLVQRTKLALESYRHHLRNMGRMRLQRTLTELHLGQLRKVSLDDLTGLTSDQLTHLLTSLLQAYPQSEVAGALYLVLDKGTKNGEYNTWLRRRCEEESWNSSDFSWAVRLVHFAGLTPTGDLLREASSTPGAFFRTHILQVRNRDLQRLVTLSFPSEHVASLVDGIVLQDYTTVLANPEADPFETAAALLEAQRHGVSATDPQVVAAMRDLPSSLRTTLVRNRGAIQDWMFTALMGNRS